MNNNMMNNGMYNNNGNNNAMNRRRRDMSARTPEQPMNRRQLLNHINQVSFAVDETKLYLDTHPCDREALAYFREMSHKRNHALKEYAEAYGPLTIDTAAESCTERWNWINEPWPWQEGGC